MSHREEHARLARRIAEPPERIYEVLGHVRLRKVLLLEDDRRLAEVLQASLEVSGYQITHVTSGVDGLKLVLENDYDLILCDMAMPGFPGDMFYRAVERVRSELCHRFLFMTGHTGDERIIAFIRSIRGLLIWKPFQLQHLLETANLVMKKADARSRLMKMRHDDAATRKAAGTAQRTHTTLAPKGALVSL